MNKAELIALVEARRSRIESILAEQTAQALDQKIQGDWSFKDTLAHIVFWDNELVKYLDGTVRDQYVPSQREDDDKVNARIYRANRDRTLDEVSADFRDVYQRLIDFLVQVDEDDITMPSTRMINWTLASHIVNNMEHVDEHLAVLAPSTVG